jgi:hypothetical protein
MMVRARVIPATQETLTREVCTLRLAAMGGEGAAAGRLDEAADRAMLDVASLSRLTEPLAVDYLERLRRPLPALSPEMGVQIVGRSYLAHLAVEEDPEVYLAEDVPVLGTLPPARNGYAPNDLLNRVVKVSRRSFEPVCAVSERVWEGFVLALTTRAHQMPRDTEEPVAIAAVDGLARFGWVLRQVDIHYGTQPERRRAL